MKTITTPTTAILKEHFEVGSNLLILLSGMEAITRMIAASVIDGNLTYEGVSDAAYLLADLTGVARSIVEDAQ
ncbi:hypothetical protein ACXX82_06460 [Glaciimonas sp. GNP009]